MSKPLCAFGCRYTGQAEIDSLTSALPCHLYDDYIPVTVWFGFCTHWLRWKCASDNCEEAR